MEVCVCDASALLPPRRNTPGDCCSSLAAIAATAARTTTMARATTSNLAVAGPARATTPTWTIWMTRSGAEFVECGSAAVAVSDSASVVSGQHASGTSGTSS